MVWEVNGGHDQLPWGAGMHAMVYGNQQGSCVVKTNRPDPTAVEVGEQGVTAGAST